MDSFCLMRKWTSVCGRAERGRRRRKQGSQMKETFSQSSQGMKTREIGNNVGTGLEVEKTNTYVGIVSSKFRCPSNEQVGHSLSYRARKSPRRLISARLTL